MSIQTEIKQEKALFDALAKKIKQSKSIKREENKSPKTGNITIKYYLDKMNILINISGSDSTYASEFDAENLTVKDKQNKTILTMNVSVPDVEGDALEFCENRKSEFENFVQVLHNRYEDEQDRLEQLEEVKRAAKRLKASKELRKKQQAEAVLTLKALETIQSL